MSAWIDSNYSITINSSGYIFYGSDDELIINLSGSCDLSVSAYVIAKAESEIEADSNVTVDATRIQFASSSISIDSNASVSSLKIAYSESTLSIDSSAIITAKKIAFASASSSIDSNLSVSSLKFAFSNSSLSSSASISISVFRIVFAEIDAEGSVIKVTVGKEILLAKIIATANVTVRNIPAIRFSPSIIEDTQHIRPLLLINNNPLTEHNRQIDIAINQSYLQNTNWNSRKSRYYRKFSDRKIFSINWSELPNSRSMTVDEKHGRDFIQKIASDPRVHSLKFLEIDSDEITPYTQSEYNVIVKSYTESLIRRDLVGNTYYWNCSLELEEV